MVTEMKEETRFRRSDWIACKLFSINVSGPSTIHNSLRAVTLTTMFFAGGADECDNVQQKY